MSKKITKNLDSKLAKYAAAAGAVAGVTGANAQIVYTDVNPDSTITGNQQIVLDIDNDGTNDFTILTQNITGSTGTFYGYNAVKTFVGGQVLNFNSSASASWMATSNNLPAMLNAGDTIMPTATWAAGKGRLQSYLAVSYPSSTSYNFNTNVGNWGGAMGQFAGLKFKSGANTYYGWVRMDVDSAGTTIVIKDYAYQSIADSSIIAGAHQPSGVGVQENLDGQINVYASLNKIIVENSTKKTNGVIEIVNMAGELVETVFLNNNREVIDASSLSTGIYIVNAKFEGDVISNKVYIK